MSNVGRVDQAVMQLRAQLQRLARARTEATRGSTPADPTALQRLRQMGSATAFGEEEFRRRFIRALLIEELGETLGNQPKLDQISKDVWRMLDEDPDARALMDEALRQLGPTGQAQS